jgi:hypothetical protein
MKHKATFALLIALVLLAALIVPAGAGTNSTGIKASPLARPALPEGGMATKRSVTPDCRRLSIRDPYTTKFSTSFTRKQDLHHSVTFSLQLRHESILTKLVELDRFR